MFLILSRQCQLQQWGVLGQCSSEACFTGNNDASPVSLTPVRCWGIRGFTCLTKAWRCGPSGSNHHLCQPHRWGTHHGCTIVDIEILESPNIEFSKTLILIPRKIEEWDRKVRRRPFRKYKKISSVTVPLKPAQKFSSHVAHGCQGAR